MLFGKKQNKQIDPLQTIIDNIVIDAGLSNLPEADMLAFKSNLEMQFNRRIGLIVVDNLPEEGIKEYGELLQESEFPDISKLQNLISKYIPNFEEKLKNGLDEFIEEIMQSIKK